MKSLEVLKTELASAQDQLASFQSERARLQSRLEEAQSALARAEAAVPEAESLFRNACTSGSDEAAASGNVLRARECASLQALRVQALQAALDSHTKGLRSVDLEEIIRVRTGQLWEACRDQELSKAVEAAGQSLYRAFSASQRGRSHTQWREFLGRLENSLPHPDTDSMRDMQQTLSKKHGLPIG